MMHLLLKAKLIIEEKPLARLSQYASEDFYLGYIFRPFPGKSLYSPLLSFSKMCQICLPHFLPHPSLWSSCLPTVRSSPHFFLSQAQLQVHTYWSMGHSLLQSQFPFLLRPSNSNIISHSSLDIIILKSSFWGPRQTWSDSEGQVERKHIKLSALPMVPFLLRLSLNCF